MEGSLRRCLSTEDLKEGRELSDWNPFLASASLPEAGDFLQLQQEPRAAPILRVKVAARG